MKYDVIVVGGGHAGCEAALASARSGALTLLLTDNMETLGQMSCNPAIGGIGKSHLVREIDALGGMMALAADEAGIQFRRLNTSRGAAVRATRAQCDRLLYKIAVRRHLGRAANLRIVQQSVVDLAIVGGAVRGVKTADGRQFAASAVVLTVGTFLNGRMHIGNQQTAGGRSGCPAVTALAQRLAELKLPVGRLKTGTPPRLDGNSIDFSGMARQPSDTPLPVMSFIGNVDMHPQQVDCHITRTCSETHDIIHAGLHDSPLFGGEIEGVGPRYCPSIEDKVVRFAERDSHRVFLEPEGLAGNEYYPNGISTSLPAQTQEAFIHSIPGLKNAHITRYGYAIEYDYFDPRALLPSLCVRALPGLFFAGQINGTTGYEEAAAQGLVAGINAARLSRDLPAWTPSREEAYIGVMIDDLTARGVSEPYRMFTSRAEYRLMLREDNADLRLTPIGRELKIVDDDRYRSFEARRQRLDNEARRLEKLPVSVDGVSAGMTAEKWLRRAEVSYADIVSGAGLTEPMDIAEIEARIKYAGYIAHQNVARKQARSEEAMEIPKQFNFAEVNGLSLEVRELLICHHPATIRQARQISGVTPAALSLLVVHLKKTTGKMHENFRRH